MQPQRHRGTEANFTKLRRSPSWPLCLCGLILLLASGTRAAWSIAVPNAGFEQIDPHGIPVGWQHVTFWSDSHFHLETANPHSGHYAVRIDGAPHAQGYLRMTDAIDVSPGEVLEAGAWVKLKDVPPNQMATVAADFTNTDGQTNDFARFVNIPGNSSASHDWTYVHGTINAPPMAASMHLRLGFWDGQGTVWFDDVQLLSHTAVGCRIDLPWGELLPSSPYIPVSIINRDRIPVLFARLILNNRIVAKVPVYFRAGVRIPIHIPKPGTYLTRVEVVDPKDRLLASDSRMLTVPSAMKMSPPIPTHWAFEDGPPHIDGDINLAVTKEDLKAATIEVRLVDSSGVTQSRWMPDMQTRLGSELHYQLDSPAIPISNYTITADLHRPDQSDIHLQHIFTVLPRQLAGSSINANGYLVYDGKPIFPLGIFNGDARLKEMSEAGFTINHAYNACDVVEGREPDDSAAENFLDETERAGLKAIFLLPRDYIFHRDWPALRRRIRMFKNHPALVAWDEEEGIARGDLSPDDLKKVVQIVHEEDPNHPILIGDSRDEIEKIKDRSNFFPVNQMDLGIWWWYPIPPRGHGTALNGDEDTAGLELTPPSFLIHRNTDKPIWVGVQAYDKKGEDPTFKTARYPTPAEYRAQAYIAIISGAKGLMWYGGSVAGGIYEDPKAAHWDDLKKLVAELHAMIPTFFSPTIPPPSFDPSDAPISIMRKHMIDGDVIMAVNRGAVPMDIIFHLVASPQDVEVVNENRNAKLHDDEISDHFAAYAVHIYRLPHMN